eukprot:scaffold1954_cov146-Alexandrium_tamarense.AAC.17
MTDVADRRLDGTLELRRGDSEVTIDPSTKERPTHIPSRPSTVYGALIPVHPHLLAAASSVTGMKRTRSYVQIVFGFFPSSVHYLTRGGLAAPVHSLLPSSHSFQPLQI